jgi:hypothetical protein
MPRYEYETVEIEASMWTSEPKGLETRLNEYAARGWRLVQILPPPYAGFSKFLAVMERETG